MESRQIKTDSSTSLRVTRRGDHSEAVVLLHGGPGMYDYLRDATFARQLSQDISVISYDQRGSSLSPSTGPFSIDDHVRDLERVVEEFNLSPVKLIGHSFGSIVALHYAIRNPSSVQLLVMVSPPGLDVSWRTGFESTVAARMSGSTRTRIQELGAKLRTTAIHSPQWKRIHLEILNCTLETYMDRTSGQRPPQIEEFDRAVYEEGWNSALARHADARWTARLSTLTSAIHLIHGASDPIPWSVIDRYLELLPGARSNRIEHGGHFPYIEQPKAFLAVVKGILDDVRM